MPPTTPQDRKPARKTTAKKTTPRKTAAKKTVEVIDPQNKYAPTAWGSSAVGGAEDLEVPSGQLCLVRRPGVEGLMREGILNDLDSLTGIVEEKHIKRVSGKPQVNVSSLMNDQENLDNMLHVVDRVICHVVLKPEIQMTPNDPTRRVNGVIYADMIDMIDKMFIFQYVVGGTRGIESFRDQFSETLGSLDT